jgi:hypothetical protein
LYQGLKIVIDPLYAPPVGWWAMVLKAEEVLIETRSWYRKGSYRNRCHIYGANGLLRLSVPLQHGKQQRSRIDEVCISYDHPWQKLHWESLCIAYRSSPYFEYYEEGLLPFYTEKKASLMDYNLALVAHISDLLSIQTRFATTDEYQDQYSRDWLDLRERFHPGATGAGRVAVEMMPYRQVFSPKLGFLADLSIYDLLFHKGPESLEYLKTSVNIQL